METKIWRLDMVQWLQTKPEIYRRNFSSQRWWFMLMQLNPQVAISREVLFPWFNARIVILVMIPLNWTIYNHPSIIFITFATLATKRCHYLPGSVALIQSTILYRRIIYLWELVDLALHDFTTSTVTGVRNCSQSPCLHKTFNEFHRNYQRVNRNYTEKFELRNNDDYNMIIYFIHGRSIFCQLNWALRLSFNQWTK